MGSENVIELILKATNKTQAALRAPISDLGDLSGALKGSSLLWGAMASAAAAALMVMGQHSIEAGEHANLMSEKIGVASEVYTAYAYAAGQANINTESFDKGFKKLSQTIEGAATGEEKATETMKALGVAVTDANGKIRPTDEILRDVAQRFSEMPNGAGKATMAIELLGKAGMDMVPLLNEGADGLARMQQKAAALGQVISGQTAEASEKFADSMTDVKAGSQGLVNHWVADLLPTMQVLVEHMVGAVEEGGLVSTVFQALAAVATWVFKEIAESVVTAMYRFEALGIEAAALGAAIYDGLHGNFKQAAADLESGFDQIAAANDKAQAEIDRIWNGNVVGPKVDKHGAQTDLEEVLNAQKEAKKKKEDMDKESLERAKVLHAQEIDSYKHASLAEIDAKLASYSAKRQLSAQELQDVAKLEADRQAILDVSHNAEIQKMKSKSTEEIREALAVYATKKSLTVQETRDQAEMQKFLVENNKKRVENLKSTMAYLATASHSGNAALAAIGKAAAITQATIDAYQAFGNALGGAPYPYNLVVAGAVLAVGLDNVANIAGVPGFASGGVLGGSFTAGDQQLFRGNAGEEVLTTEDRRRTTSALLGALEQARGGAGPGGGVLKVEQTLNVDGHPLFKAFWEASLDGRMRISPRALVGAA